jgi:MYXO-CTERM domain-containing protein
MNAYVTSYTDNLLLHSITVEVEVDRKAQVPESNPALLLALGLLAIGFLRRRKNA